MNSGFRPLSKDIPFKRRAWMMVDRGEARSFGEACKMMRQSSDQPRTKSDPKSSEVPRNYRAPYKD